MRLFSACLSFAQSRTVLNSRRTAQDLTLPLKMMHRPFNGTFRARRPSCLQGRLALLLRLSVAFVTTLGSISATHAQDMFVSGQFNVSPSGAATYHVPIKLPPGVAGTQPDLALNYSSQAGNGLLGVGWSLSGLSTVTRCPKTMAQDGIRGSVNFDTEDRYCLDGQRLVAVRDPANAGAVVGNYGANGTYYTTEQEAFNRVQSFGSVGTGTASTGRAYYGPSYFIVKTKAGLIMEYGSTTDSRVLAVGKTVVRYWALSKVIDSNGNYFTVKYNDPDATNGQSYPTQIIYTRNDTATPALSGINRIDFGYVPRPDVVPTFVAGSLVKNNVRLNSISIFVSGSMVREYRINYGSTSQPARSIIASIQECASASNCLPPLSFEWSNLVSGWNNTGWVSGPQPGTPIGDQCVIGDFDADAKSDLACYTGGGGNWHVALATSGDAWSSALWSGGAAPGSPIGNQCFTGDFNGDGRTDLTCYTGSNGNWHVTLSTGKGWLGSSWLGGPAPGVPIGGQCVVGDLNGDGKSDLACYTGGNGIWAYSFSTGSGWQTSSGAGGNAPAGPIEGNQCFTGDYNGDGKTDLACHPGSGTTWVMSLAKEQGTGWQGALWTGGSAPGLPISAQCMSGDYNGDGKTDIVCYPGTGTTWAMQLSTGTGWATSAWDSGNTPGSPIGSQCMSADLNGDGKTDMACFTGGNAEWGVTLSTGTSWIPSIWAAGNNPGAPIGRQCVPGDFNGDGKTDIICYPGNGTTWWLSAPSTTQFASLSAISNGGGLSITPHHTMASRTLGNRVTRTGGLAPHQRSSIPVMPIVTDVDTSDGVGGTRRTSYWYDSPVSETGTGRGYLGFQYVVSQDMSTGLKSTTSFRLDFPYIGLPDVTTTNKANGTSLSRSTNTYACLDPATGLTAACSIPPPYPAGPVAAKAYFVYPSESQKRAWDLNGAGLPGTRTTNANLDAYGNFGTVTTLTLNPDGSPSEFSKTLSNSYYNDPGRWFLGRLTQSTVVASGSTVPAPVIPGSGALPPTPGPTLPPQLLSVILNLLLDD